MTPCRILALLIFAAALTIGCGDDARPPAEDGAISSTASVPTTVANATSAAPTADATIASSQSAVAVPSPSTPPTPPTRVPPSGPSITISAVGDISLARQVVERMEAGGALYPYALITPLLDGDIVLGNLEGALTDRGEPWPKGYNFRTPPRFATGLSDAGFDVVSLANNHTMDYGAIGLTDTLSALDAAGVRRIGAGVNALEAHIPAIIEVRGLRVAFLGYAASPTESGGFAIADWQAGIDTPGLAIGTADAISRDVAAAKTAADFVIVVVHAGSEYVNTPNSTQRTLADAALAAGADAYIGHHAHVVQPVEQRGGQIIAWGLGNFIFDLDDVDLANIPVPRVSLVLRLTLTPGAGVTAWEALPVTLDDAEDRPRPATADEAAVLQSLLTP